MAKIESNKITKITEINNFNVVIQYECPNNNKLYNAELDKINLLRQHKTCDICGGKGYVKYKIINCVGCDETHEITLIKY
jgi:hypothetical protein